MWQEKIKCSGKFSVLNLIDADLNADLNARLKRLYFWKPFETLSKWNGCLWCSYNTSVELYDGFSKISARFTKLHTWNRKLWVSERPFQTENCFLDGYAQADMELEMMGGTAEKAISGVEKLQLSQFEVHKHDFIYRLQKFATGSYPRLSLQFLLKRNIGYFLLQTYMPCSLITILRFASYDMYHLI